MRNTTAIFGFAAFLLTQQAAAAEEVRTAGPETQDLSELTSEEPAQLRVRSASKNHLLGRSHMNLADRLDLNAGRRWVVALEPFAAPAIGDNVEADARLACQISDQLELFLAGRNLLHRTHAESDDVQLAQRSLSAGTRIWF